MSNEVQTRHGRATAEATQAGASGAPHRVPPVDVFEDESGITLLADLPGVSRDRLSVRVDGDSLTIEGTAEVTGPREMELVYGDAQPPVWRRAFTLSRELDAGRIEAQLKDGVLRLTVPKAEEARPRRIEVRVG
ncbi:MAG TPA: Hsp20/alpha crystallin family protein [Ramlibacter sp.]|jgi:HSP20 family molecular chaperone IbpA|uniref:Hsp20/alpha crystallin family protein n=1 Tax=Ramlibacter sp. TaxID=1917967 RepID=UPI002D4BCBD0|nr:Hsp20/alpha crystallin family protein [Ramlibacter sp.]HZY20558.1 Hsp20/alpha crystallin family protein [Ramlibacter sp.]